MWRWKVAVEVRWTTEDPDLDKPPQDFKDFQERVTDIPENFVTRIGRQLRRFDLKE